MSAKIKKAFPRLPICIIADGLYVTQRVLQICADNKWKYIIRYKEGSAPLIEKEYQALPEHEYAGAQTEYANKIIFQKIL